MKKRFVILLLSLALLMQFSSTTAFAANETHKSAIVSYTIDDPIYYEIDIPYTNILNVSDVMNITAKNISIPNDKMIEVSISDSSFNASGRFFLFDEEGYRSIQCQIFSVNVFTYEEREINSSYRQVATFVNGDNPSTKSGRLRFVPVISEYDNLPGGTYTGTLFFDIKIIGKD